MCGGGGLGGAGAGVGGPAAAGSELRRRNSPPWMDTVVARGRLALEACSEAALEM